MCGAIICRRSDAIRCHDNNNNNNNNHTDNIMGNKNNDNKLS